MKRLYIALAKPAHGGFGMYDCGEQVACDEAKSIEEYTNLLDGDGIEYYFDHEIDGRIYNQNGGTVLRIREEDDSFHYEILWEKEEKEDKE